MLTDWVLVRRIAFELDARLRGGRVRDVGLLPDGRTAIAVWTRGETQLLCIDVFGSPPLVTLETGELPIAPEPGFVRALGAALRGTSCIAVRSRKGDRLLRLTFGTRSRFGVGDEVDVYVELVPRFGNVILVKGDIVVSAAKEFSLAENPERAVQAGMVYQAPPMRVRAALAAEADPAQFESDAPMREPVYVYSRDGRIAQIYVMPLEQYADAACVRVPSLLDALLNLQRDREGAGVSQRSATRRRAFFKRLDTREHKLRRELESVATKRGKAMQREMLREEGEAIYATLHEIDDAAKADAAKEQAAKIFAQYKKLGVSLPHLEERERGLRTQLEAVEELRWEAERAQDADLDDVQHAIDDLDPRAVRPAKILKRRKRAPLEVRTASGARILIGRSPGENADLTFRVARPNDLWFHAQRVPGAHVVLQRDDREVPSSEDIERAAALAAHYSKAQASDSVAVDYTMRKHVRKQKDAPPGLVWYTNFKTVVAAPEPV